MRSNGEVLGLKRLPCVSSSTVSRKLVALTATKLEAFPKRSLADFTPFALFLDTIHRGGEAFLVALGVDLSGEKRALGCWQGSLENHEIGEALFNDLERRGLARSRQILFVTDGGSGVIQARRARFGKKLVHQRGALPKSRNLQRARGSAMLQRWLGTVVLYCEQQFNRVKGIAGIAQVLATIEAEHTEPQLVQTKKAA